MNTSSPQTGSGNSNDGKTNMKGVGHDWAHSAEQPAIKSSAHQEHSAGSRLKPLQASKALLLIDIQNDYFPGGAMELVGSIEASQHARRLLTGFRRKGLPVVHIQHIATQPNAGYLLPNTPGSWIHDSVKPAHDETVFYKKYPNSFRGTTLLDFLDRKSITQLIIVGMMTHMCIDTTTRTAHDLGFECYIAQDACATKALSFGGVSVMAASVQTTTLAALNGSFALVQSTDELYANI